MDKIIDSSVVSIGCRPYFYLPYNPPASYYTHKDILNAWNTMCTPIEYKMNFLNRIEFSGVEDQFHLSEKTEKFVPKEYYSKFTNGRWAYHLISSNI